MTIRVNYENVGRQVSRLRALAEDQLADASRLEAVRAELGATWQDPAGSAYGFALAQLIGEMQSSASRVNRLATELESAATQFRQQEETGARLARELRN